MASARYPGPQVAAGELADPAIIYLPNSNAVMVAGVTLDSTLETATAGSEDSSLSIRLLRSGVVTEVAKFNGKNATGNFPLSLPVTNADGISVVFNKSGDQEIHKTTGGNLYIRSRDANGALLAMSTQVYPGVVINQVTGGTPPDIILGANVDPGLTATQGFIWIPTVTASGTQSGTPQGSAGNYTSHAPMVANTADSKLWIRFGSTWKSSVFI